MAYITNKLGDRIYITNHKPKSKTYSKGTNIHNLPTSAIVEGKLVQDIYYQVWSSMLNRASKTDSTVCKEWLEFSNFKLWMKKYDFIGKELNHTLLVPGNKHYDKDTCIFVTAPLAKLFTEHSDNDLPTGVTLENKRYRARISIEGTQRHLGRFDSSEEAREAYVLAKIADATRITNEYDGDRLVKMKKGLKAHIELLKNSLN